MTAEGKGGQECCSHQPIIHSLHPIKWFGACATLDNCNCSASWSTGSVHNCLSGPSLTNIAFCSAVPRVCYPTRWFPRRPHTIPGGYQPQPGPAVSLVNPQRREHLPSPPTTSSPCRHYQCLVSKQYPEKLLDPYKPENLSVEDLLMLPGHSTAETLLIYAPFTPPAYITINLPINALPAAPFTLILYCTASQNLSSP